MRHTLIAQDALEALPVSLFQRRAKSFPCTKQVESVLLKSSGFLFFSFEEHFKVLKSTMRLKTRLTRSETLIVLSLVFAFIFAAMQLKTNFGGNALGGATQLVTTCTRNANVTEIRPVGRAYHSSIRHAYAYHLHAPEKLKKQPRPGHWFHLIEFHLPLNPSAERSNFSGDSFNLLLLLPKKSWLAELTPMTRFFLASIYSTPFARRDVATVVFPRSVNFLSAENLLRAAHGIKSSKIDGDRASIVTKRSNMWSSTIHQSLLDRFILDDGHDCGDADETVEFDTEFISSSGAKSGTDFGRVNSPVHEWFATIENVQTMRRSFETLCQVEIDSTANAIEFLTALPQKLCETKAGCLSEMMLTVNESEKKKHQAVIYQRDVNRKFKDFDQVKGDVKRILGSDWSVSVIMHDDDNPPCLLYHCLKHAELLITPHGFQSMLAMFLPNRAYMFEIFPLRYHWTGYKALGLMFGVRHVWVESPPLTVFGCALSAAFTTKRCMASYFCRYLVRKSDVSFNKLSSSILENIGEGKMMESAHVQSVRDIIVASNDPLSQCVSECERDDDCFTVHVAPVCVHFMLPTSF